MKNWAFRLLSVMGVLFCSLTSYAIDSALPMRFECVLRYTPGIECQELKRDFFQTYGNFFTEENVAFDATISLKLTDVEGTPQATRYRFEYVGFTYETEINITQDRLMIKNALFNDILSGASRYLKVKEVISENGEIKITLVPQGEPSPALKQPKLWSATAGASGSFNRVGKGVDERLGLNAQVPLTYQWIKKKTKFIGSADLGYSYAKAPGVDPLTEKARSYDDTNISASTRLVGVRNIAKRVSFALIFNGSRNPGANVNFRSDVGAGIEWTLVPFRNSETVEVAVRGGIDQSHYALSDPNDLGNTTENVTTGFLILQSYFSMYEGKIVLTLGGYLIQNFTYQNYGHRGVYGDVTYNVSSNTAFVVRGNYGRQEKSLSFPAVVDYQNPAANAFLSGQPGGQTSMSIGINFTFGNAILRQRDRRWSNW